MLTFATYPWPPFAQLRAEWARLVERLGANPTLSPDWIDVVLGSHGATHDTRLLVARRGTELAGVLPYRRIRQRSLHLPMRALEPLSNLVSYHPMLLGDDCAAALLEELLGRDATRGWDQFSMLSVVAGSATHAALADYARRTHATLIERPAERSPYLPVRQDWQSFYRGKTSKFRNNLQRSARLVNSAGAAEVRWFTSALDAAQLLEVMLAIEAESWKSDAAVDIGRRRHETDYYRALLPLLATRGSLLANALFLDGRPVAYSLVCVWGGWAGFLKNTYVERCKALGAGAHLIHLLLERAFGAGVHEIDFLGDALPYKLAWTPAVREHVDVLLFSRAPLARIVGFLQQRRAAMKRSEDRAPVSPSAAESDA
jgi:CelD/BcsL family acetyltransferase involved in cellulose biosynthesis